MPGDTLPMKLFRHTEHVKLRQALNAPAPYTRLIAVVSSCAVALRGCGMTAAMTTMIGMEAIAGAVVSLYLACDDQLSQNCHTS